MRYRVLIGTTNKTREFRYDSEKDARWAANELWKWAKSNGERGTISIYEHKEGRLWALVQTVKV